MKLKIKNYFSRTITVKPRVGLYSVKGLMGEELPGLAILLDQIKMGEEEEFAVLTKSFGEFIGCKNSAYIDTNNCSFANQILEAGIAKDTGWYKTSGFCKYPLWTFDEDFLKRIGGADYQKYSDAYDAYMGSFYHEEGEVEEGVVCSSKCSKKENH